MTLTAAETLALLTADHIEVKGGCWLLDVDDVPREDISDDLLGGEVEVNNSAPIAGTANFSISRPLAWNTDRLWPYMTVTAPELGLSDTYHLGVFLPLTPDLPMGETPATFAVQAYSKEKLLDHPVGDSYFVAAGTAYLDAVASVVTASGVSGAALQLDSTAVETTLSADMVWMLSDSETITWLRVVNDLLAAVSYRPLWADSEGRYCSEPYVSPVTKTVTWTFDLADLPTQIVGEMRSLTQDEWSATNWWRFISRKSRTTAASEGDGFYTVDRSDSGVKIKKPVYKDVESQTELVAAGDADVEQETTRKTTIAVPCSPLPIFGHWDTAQYDDNETGLGSVKCQVASWRLPLDGRDMSLQIEVLPAPVVLS
jgi:hypothetical protein